MPTAKFMVGDRVVVGDLPGAGPIPDQYEIVRVLPFEHTAGFLYRLQRIPAGEQRVVPETFLKAAPNP